MKKNFHKIHIYISLFFLPVAIVYAITGALYIFGVDEDSGALINTYEVDAKQQLRTEETAPFMIDYLKKNNITLPSNLEARNSKGGITIGGIRYSAQIKAKNSNIYEIKIIKRTIYGSLVLLHKAKGEYYFNILAVGFSMALIFLYFSGFFITSFCYKRRKKAFATFGVGLLFTIIFAYLSM